MDSVCLCQCVCVLTSGISCDGAAAGSLCETGTEGAAAAESSCVFSSASLSKQKIHQKSTSARLFASRSISNPRCRVWSDIAPNVQLLCVLGGCTHRSKLSEEDNNFKKLHTASLSDFTCRICPGGSAWAGGTCSACWKQGRGRLMWEDLHTPEMMTACLQPVSAAQEGPKEGTQQENIGQILSNDLIINKTASNIYIITLNMQYIVSMVLTRVLSHRGLTNIWLCKENSNYSAPDSRRHCAGWNTSLWGSPAGCGWTGKVSEFGSA